jgi:hypothetical protein
MADDEQNWRSSLAASASLKNGLLQAFATVRWA